MGQGYSKEKSSSNYGSIYLQTDAPYYLTGTMVTGKIYLNIYEAFPAAFLDIQIKGKEKTKWVDHEQRRKDDGQYESVRVKRKGEKGIIYTRVPLFTFPDRIVLPGQYCYPFSFPLSNGIPGSVLISNHDFKAQIKYSLTAILEPWKDKHIKKMKYKQRLILREPAVAQYGDMFDDAQNVTSCCCFSKGMSKVRASFEKNFYTPQEVARCSAWIDNSACSVNVSRINLQLRLRIDLKDDHGRHRHFDQIVCSRSYPGIGKNEKTGDDEARFLELNLQEYKYTLKPRKKKAWGQQDMAFGSTVPPNANGSRAKVWYTLEVAPVYDDLICCTTQPRVDLPMYIMPDQLPFFGQVQMPQNWNPQEYDVNNFVLEAGAQQPAKGALPAYYQQLQY